MTDAYSKVLICRDKNRISPRELVEKIFTDFIEFHGDRRYGDDSAIVGGIAYFMGEAVTVIATNKGADTKQKIKNNFGSPHPEGYRKALRLMKQAEKFSRPVICLIDTAGAYCGIGAEERGQGLAIAENITEMLKLKTPIISLLTGEGGSGGALALAAADKVLMLENAIYSVISPEGCASILWKDASRAKDAAESLKLCANDLAGLNICDGIISEAGDVYKNISDALKDHLTQLKTLSKAKLIDNRYNKYRRAGTQYV